MYPTLTFYFTHLLHSRSNLLRNTLASDSTPSNPPRSTLVTHITHAIMTSLMMSTMKTPLTAIPSRHPHSPHSHSRSSFCFSSLSAVFLSVNKHDPRTPNGTTFWYHVITLQLTSLQPHPLPPGSNPMPSLALAYRDEWERSGMNEDGHSRCRVRTAGVEEKGVSFVGLQEGQEVVVG
jgi:hypothetical protein